jgi:endonuclease YncB( thermonuclease family)
VRPILVVKPSSRAARPFLFCVATALSVHSPTTYARPDCLADAPKQAAKIDYVIDGDTLVLLDKRKIRVLGINTPEMHPPAQAMSKEATQAAKSLLPTNADITIYKSFEAEDRHGRTLAHVVNHQGVNLAEHLLSKGLAAAIAIQPNVRCADHYKNLENIARDTNQGLWAKHHSWQLVDKRINKKRSGFRLVTSNVNSIKRDNNHVHLLLENGLRTYMKNTLADEINAEALVGKRVSVRGWIQYRKNKASLRLHHANNLRRHN